MNRHARIHFMISLVLLIAAGASYYVWFSYVSSLSVQASALANQIDLKSQDSARSAQAKSALSALSASEASLNARFISSGDIVPYLESVQRTGKSLGATVKVASVAENDGNPVGTLALTLTISGSYESVVRTLGVLENASIDTSLGSVTLDTTPTFGSSTPVWTASTILTVGIHAGASGAQGITQSQSASSSAPSAVPVPGLVVSSTSRATTVPSAGIGTSTKPSPKKILLPTQ